MNRKYSGFLLQGVKRFSSGMAKYGARIPIVAFIAPSGTGKTTLMSCVIAQLTTQHGLRVGVIKQARDDFDVDIPGKDSYELRKAGVDRLLLASGRRSALVVEHPGRDEPQLQDLLALFDQQQLDLILIEGFSTAPVPKIELRRKGYDPRRYPQDPWVIARVIEGPGNPGLSIAELNLNDPALVADFVLAYLARCQELQQEILTDE